MASEEPTKDPLAQSGEDAGEDLIMMNRIGAAVGLVMLMRPCLVETAIYHPHRPSRIRFCTRYRF